MLGKGVSGEHFQPRKCSGKNAPKTWQAKRNLKNVVYIDVDSDQVDDVVIIDYPEFVSKTLLGSSGASRDRTSTPQSVISIDDDDDGDGDDDDDDGDGDDDDDDENIGVSNPGIDAEANGELDSDASSSQRFSSASGRRKNSVHIDVDDCDVYEEDSVTRKQKSKEASISDQQKHKEACSAKAADRNHFGLYASDSESSDSDCSDCEVLEREQWEKVSAKRKRSVFNDQVFHDEHASSSGLHSSNYNGFGVENRTAQPEEGPLYSGPSNGKYVEENRSSFTVKDDSRVDGFYRNLKTDNSFKDSSQKVEKDNFTSPTPRFESMKEMHSFCQSSDIEQGEKTSKVKGVPCPISKNCNFCNGVTGASRYKKKLRGEESKFTSLRQDAHDNQFDNGGSALRSEDENLSKVNSNLASSDERHVNGDGDGFKSHTEDGDYTASKETDLINEKEKLKETDEYKKAMEEEWASRQRQLQIQAEESQRLRKRKKAESQRLLDMQRRQKERIEEVRETQKKDEEFNNMKDQLRVEIQKGLKELEMKCSDMTSMLRGLGIHVGGSSIPLPNEVHAAYKRAMFKFHPDRASKTDLREQVEAEEKFKLISRLKEKLSK